MDDDNPAAPPRYHTASTAGNHDTAYKTTLVNGDKDIHHISNNDVLMQRSVCFYSRSVKVGERGRMGWPPLLLILLLASLHLVTSTPLLITSTPDAITTQLLTIMPKHKNINFTNSIVGIVNSSSIVTTTPTTTFVRELTSTTLLSPSAISSPEWLQQHNATFLQNRKRQTGKSSLWDKHLRNEKLGVGSGLSSRGRPRPRPRPDGGDRPRPRPRPDDGTRWTQQPNEDIGPDLTNELGDLIILPCTNLSADYIMMLQDIPGKPISITEFRDAGTSSFSVPNLRDAEDPIEMAGLFQGDIQLSPLDHAVAQLTTQLTPTNIRNAIVDVDRKWPDGVIPYVISNYYSRSERMKIAKAMSAFHDQTCIKFVPRRGHSDYIHILKDHGCSSYVGRQGGMQKVSIGKGCEFEGVIMHELMHSTGFWHEHSRQDRDHYVRIVWGNIKRGEESNFYIKKWGTEIQNLQVSYDLGSIMHYSATAFSRGPTLDTIVVRNPGVEKQEIGQRRAFSNKDIEKINKLYNCPSRPYYETQTPSTTSLPAGPCEDGNIHCAWWAEQGECRSNSYWMEEYCTKSCQRCSTTTSTTSTTTTPTTPAPPPCIDEAEHCKYWTSIGECYKNSVYMNLYCAESCRSC